MPGAPSGLNALAHAAGSKTELEPIDERPERVVNFSRPRLNSTTSYHEPPPPPRTVRTVNAFHEPAALRAETQYGQDPLPDEPRFSLESERPNTGSENSTTSELFWDAERAELIAKPPRQSQLNMRDQRHPGPPSRESSSSGSSIQTSNSGSASSSTTTSSSAKTVRPKGILKRSGLSQSERAPDVRDDLEEDTASHHTISEDEAIQRCDSDVSSRPRWSSSDFDVSSLSEKKRKKLEKKGINPALYLEMKAARAGKGRIGALTGNTYVS